MEEKKNIYIFKSVSIKDKYNFYEYLSVMLDSGISISEALDSVSSKIKNLYFKEKIKELIVFVSSGDSFSKAMKKMPNLFDPSEVSMIEMWESTWTLVLSFSRISEDLRSKYDLRNKIKWALTYPVIIFMFLILAILVVLTYVIPSVIPLFETSGTQLPLATKMLISTSDFITSKFLWIIFFIILLIFLFTVYKNTSSWRKGLENFILSFPLIWNVYKNYLLATISWTLWTLIWSWVNTVKALWLVWKSTNNSTYEWLFDEIIIRVSSWSRIVDSMQEVDDENWYFPADFLQMLSAWEKTATLESVSKKINKQYTKEVDYSLSNLTKWIEPIAILIAWVFVLWFAFAIFWAILKVTSSVT